MGISIDLPRISKPVVQRRVMVIPDSENDTKGVERTLRFAGLLSKRGNLKEKAQGASIVQTGDLLHKNAPNPAVVDFWERLGSSAEAAGCTLNIVAGNHELEIWRRLHAGERLGLRRREQRAMQALIGTMHLFHVEGSMLFIHGYPTVKLLRHMQAYRLGTGRDLNDYNRECFQPAFDDPELLARYVYPRRQACRGCLLHDVPYPERYYRHRGAEVATLLGSFGIDLVIHGHRPERSGMQTDYELEKWLPGIRMISGDVQLRELGLGGTAIRQIENGPTEVLFLNRAEKSSSHRSNVRALLRAPNPPDGGPAGRADMGSQGQIFEMIRDDSWTMPVAADGTRSASV